MQEEKKYIGRGGWRGGGRPKKDEDKKRVVLQISGSPDFIQLIKDQAKKKNLPVSKYLIELVIKDTKS